MRLILILEINETVWCCWDRTDRLNVVWDTTRILHQQQIARWHAKAGFSAKQAVWLPIIYNSL